MGRSCPFRLPSARSRRLLVQHCLQGLRQARCRVNRGGTFDATLRRAHARRRHHRGRRRRPELCSVTPRNIAHEDDDVFMLGLQLEAAPLPPRRPRNDAAARRLRAARRAATLFHALLGALAAALYQGPAQIIEGAARAELGVTALAVRQHRSRRGLPQASCRCSPAASANEFGRHDPVRRAPPRPHRARARSGRRQRPAGRFVGPRAQPSAGAHASKISSAIPRSTRPRRSPAGISVRYANALLSGRGPRSSGSSFRGGSTAAARARGPRAGPSCDGEIA